MPYISFQASVDPPEQGQQLRKGQHMMNEGGTFLLPDRLEPDLERVHAYWNGLKRGDNDIPFWDDVKFSMRARLAREIMVIEAFENPLRFRFDLVGEDLSRRYGAAMAGKFTADRPAHRAVSRHGRTPGANLLPTRGRRGRYRIFSPRPAALGQRPY